MNAMKRMTTTRKLRGMIISMNAAMTPESQQAEEFERHWGQGWTTYLNVWAIRIGNEDQKQG